MYTEIKSIIEFIDLDSYLSSSDLIDSEFFIHPLLKQDFLSIKNNCIQYKKIKIIEKQVDSSTINGKNAFEYFLKGNLPFYGTHLLTMEDENLPFVLPEKFIFVEDYDDLDTLESLANLHNATIFSYRSFKRRSKNTFSYKSYLNLVQKCTILKKAFFYIGYDTSELASLAKNRLKENTLIYKTGNLSDEQLMFKFINEDNINFFKI
jgi:hypothetical protein